MISTAFGYVNIYDNNDFIVLFCEPYLFQAISDNIFCVIYVLLLVEFDERNSCTLKKTVSVRRDKIFPSCMFLNCFYIETAFAPWITISHVIVVKIGCGIPLRAIY